MNTQEEHVIEPGARIAVAGASGYVGGRLVPALLDAGYLVRCLVRSPAKARARPWSDDSRVEIVRCRLNNEEETRAGLDDCAGAFYLVHTMESAGKEFANRDERLARTFGEAAKDAGVRRIVYLGGLGDETEGLSEHLASRRHVEHALRSGGAPLTTLRAAMIIGSGSASFEILRYLVERLPVMVTPKWVRTESQPIAIRDVLHYLTACLRAPETAGRSLDIGGPDVLRYDELMRIMAEELGLPRRLVIPVGVLSPGLSSLWIHLVTPVGRRLARPLAEGLRNRMVCRNDDAARLMPSTRLTAREAIRRALEVQRAGSAPTAWSDAGVMRGDAEWAGGTVYRDRRSLEADADAETVFETLGRIGGDHGYFSTSFLWRVRGVLDRLVGGPGLRRGRRSPDRLRLGDALDFWRVQGVEPARRLELVAEMKLPGEARLEWTIEPLEGERTRVVQTATFRPKGLLGILYWWAVWLAHGLVFSGMLRGLCRDAARRAADASPPGGAMLAAGRDADD